MRRLQSESADSVLQANAQGYAVVIDGVTVASAPDGVRGEPAAGIARTREALLSLAQE
ncbi:hypothetical protein D3C72_2192180 [compost metagenome]